MLANKLARLGNSQTRITLVDKDENHYFQPGFLFIPFNLLSTNDIVHPKRDFLSSEIDFILSNIEGIDAEKNQVTLCNGKEIEYDQLVIATGSQIYPQEVQGLMGESWRKNIFDFYTLDGATALREFFRGWEGGRLVLNVAEVPIKCPVAPLEFLYLADWYFQQRGMRDKVELVYATPLNDVISKPDAAKILHRLLEKKGGRVETEFFIMEADTKANLIRSYDGREISYDLLVTIPTNMGSPVMQKSGLGNELNYVPVDKRTLQSKTWPNIWAIGDAAGLPTPKVGSAAHLMVDGLAENLMRAEKGLEPLPLYDGRATCIMESGFKRGVILSFNYDSEPRVGHFPYPFFGPFTSLKESYINYLAKQHFNWFYWNLALKHGYIPFTS
jgi:sulfide:quinone oxidoreductase